MNRFLSSSATKYLLILCFATGLFMGMSAPTLANVVGSDGGSISVDNSGQAAWTMPVDVPSGVNGLAPNLTLSVSSGGGNGPLGVGGGLSGLSSITRCGKTLNHDGYFQAPTFTKDDAYCLDGGRLVLESGQYGESNSVYRTAVESFQRVRAIGDVNGSGPQYFLVTNRAGARTYYGASVSRNTFEVDGISSAKTVWKVDYLQDSNGNQLLYHYANVAGDAAKSETQLTQISYGRNPGQGTNANLRVELDYEARPDTAESRSRGATYSQTKRISNIKTFVASKMVRDYQIGYEQGEVTNASRIVSVQECAADGKCYRPSEMEYSPELDTNWRASSASLPSGQALLNADDKPRGTLVDINNDGKTDVVIAETDASGGVSLVTYLGSRAGWQTSTAYSLPDTLFDYQMSSDGFAKGALIDVNGDGWSDYVKAYSDNGTPVIATWRNTGAGFARDSTLDLPVVLEALQADGKVQSLAELGDLNADGLVDVVQSYRTASGTVQAAWLNTVGNGTNGWAVDAAYQPQSLMIDYTVGSEGRVLASLQDANADGLADWVESYKAGGAITNNTWVNTGQGWSASAQWSLPAGVAMFDYDILDGIPGYSFIDVNGDGLPDLLRSIYAGGQQYDGAWVHTGTGWVRDNAYQLPQAMNYAPGTGNVGTAGGLIDLNSDGHPDFMRSFQLLTGQVLEQVWLFDTDTKEWVSDGSGQYLMPFVNNIVQSDGSTHSQAEMADLDHDGFPELFNSSTGEIYTSAPVQANTYPGTLLLTRDSFKAETKLYYAITTDEGIYTPAGYSPYPNVAYNAPARVVTKVTASNGVGGTVSALHTYGEAKANAAGLGGLGYAYHGMEDGASGVQITTYLHQTYPYAGKAKASLKQLNGTTLSLSTSQMAVQPVLINGLQTIYAFPDLSLANSYTLAGELLQTTRSRTVVDNFGNTTNSVSELFSSQTQGSFETLGAHATDVMAATVAGTTLERKTETTAEFKTADLSNWIFGLPEQNTVTLTGRNSLGTLEEYTSVSSAEFLADGKPSKETLEPSHAQKVIKSYTYDAFGHRKTSSIQTNEHAKRTTTTLFSADGRFPKSVTNSEGNAITSEFDVLAGKPNLVTDPNGIKKEILYDGFGTVLRETKTHQSNGATRGRQIVLPKWCDGNQIASVNCPQYAEYFITALDDEGEAPEVSYFDRNGKELRKQTYGYDGKIIVVDRTYDSEGRVLTASQPYFRSEPHNAYVTLYRYDELGREVERVNGANDTFLTDYDGLTVSVTNPGNNDSGQQVSKVVNNVNAQVIESWDAAGSATRYEYDGRGKLVKTIDAKNNVATITYDPVFGRKVKMDDPDLGVWHYKYDALGRLVEQTDAKGQKTAMEYDSLNRLITRTDDVGGANAEVTRWTYSSQKAAGKIIGGLEKVQSSNLTRTVTYDMFGRIDSAKSIIDGKTFTQRSGYKGTADKLDWVQYPSGLSVRNTYDDYGFPSTVEGISDLNLSVYSTFLTASDKLNDLQREFEGWKDQNLSPAALAELEESERQVRRLGKYLSDFYSDLEKNPSLKAQQQHQQDVAQRYIDLVNRVQKKIEQHQNWLKTYQAQADVIQARLKPQIERQDVLVAQHTPLYNSFVEEEKKYNKSKSDHDNYQAKATRYAGYINAQVKIIDAQQIQVNNNTIHVNNLIRSLFTPQWSPHYIKHWEAIFVDMDCCAESVVRDRMKTTNGDLISSHIDQIANYLNLYSVAADKMVAANKKITDGNWEWWYDHWETRRAREYRVLKTSGDRLTSLNNSMKPLVTELNQIAARTKPDHDRLTDWLVPIIESHNNVIISFNDRARGYVNNISKQTGTFVSREDLKWETFLKPFSDHLNYAVCLSTTSKTPGKCRAENLVHVYDADGNVDSAKQTAERAKVDDRAFIDIASFWQNRRFFCAAHYGYNCPSVFQTEIKQLAKLIHSNQCARYNTKEKEYRKKELGDDPHYAKGIVPCDTAKWNAQKKVSGGTADQFPYLINAVAKITNVTTYKNNAITKHKARVVSLVSTATAGTYNAETTYEDIVNNRIWQANPDGVSNDKPQSREKQCVAWLPSKAIGKQPVCTSYQNKASEPESDISYVLIRKGEIQNLIYSAQDADVRLANRTLKTHQKRVQEILQGAYVSHYLAIQDKSAEVSRLYNEVDRAYANADYVDDYEAAKKIYWQAKDINAQGQIKQAEYGNGVNTTYAYDQFGRISSVHTQKGVSSILNKTYQYDALGNLSSRYDIIDDVHETFNYDGINRLVKVNYTGAGAAFARNVGQAVVDYSYDELGNILHKSDIMDSGEQYRYGETSGSEHAGPHAVTSIPGMGDFRYDDNGNQTHGRGRDISYTAFNKPSRISKGGRHTDMWYGPERQMIKQVEEKTGGGVETTLYIGGAFEQVTETAGTVTNRHHINVAGNAIAIVDTKPIAPKVIVKESYLHKNHQSSVLAITDKHGAVVEKRYFDAFGDIKSYMGQSAGYLTSFIARVPITALSFTGHRWLATAGVIHMKGRVYDPVIARFLSADPHIQAPLNSQSLNRYAYVWNNPLSFTDPSGYFLSSIFKKLKKLFAKLKKIIKKVLKAIKKVIKAVGKALKKIGQFIKKYYKVIIAVVAIVVVAYFAPQLIPKLINAAIGAVKGGAIIGGVQGLVKTGSLTGALKGAINGAVNGAKGFVSGFTDWRGAIANFIVPGGGASWVTQAIRGGLRSGIVSKIRGNSFSLGFKQGAVGSFLSNASLWVGNQVMTGARRAGAWLNKRLSPEVKGVGGQAAVDAINAIPENAEKLVKQAIKDADAAGLNTKNVVYDPRISFSNDKGSRKFFTDYDKAKAFALKNPEYTLAGGWGSLGGAGAWINPISTLPNTGSYSSSSSAYARDLAFPGGDGLYHVPGGKFSALHTVIHEIGHNEGYNHDNKHWDYIWKKYKPLCVADPACSY